MCSTRIPIDLSQRAVNRESTAAARNKAAVFDVHFIILTLIRRDAMKSRIVRAVVAALIVGSMMLAGAAPLGIPGTLSTLSTTIGD
jgi:hypothetical protein